MKNRGLGKGLSALISGQASLINRPVQPIMLTGATLTEEVRRIKVDKIEAGPFQPRKIFDQHGIIELADSIKEHGIIQPIILKSIARTDIYQIIAGERRWRAAKLAGLVEVPAIIKNIPDHQISAQALIENIQRQDLNPLEEATAYSELMERHQYTQEALGKILGKKRSHIANMARLVVLPQSVKDKILSGILSYSHAKVIASHQEVEEVAEIVVKKQLSVRQTEQLVKNWDTNKLENTEGTNKKLEKSKIIAVSSQMAEISNSDPELEEIANNLSKKLGAQITFNNTVLNSKLGDKVSGKMIIHYEDFEQLDSILEKFSSWGGI